MFRSLLAMLPALGLFLPFSDLMTESTTSVVAKMFDYEALEGLTWAERRRWCWSSSGAERFTEQVIRQKFSTFSELGGTTTHVFATSCCRVILWPPRRFWEPTQLQRWHSWRGSLRHWNGQSWCYVGGRVSWVLARESSASSSDSYSNYG